MLNIHTLKIENQSLVGKLRILFWLCVACIPINFLLIKIPGRWGNAVEGNWLALFAAALIIFILLLKVRHVVFQSEYEIIHLEEKPLMRSVGNISDYYGVYELPKSMLLDYKIDRRGLRKRLTLISSSLSQPIRKRKADITFVSQTKIDQIRKELDIILKENGIVKK